MVVHTRIAGVVQCAALALVAVADTVIVPGAPWTDTSGNRIQAHGGGLLKVGSTFYWHGEDKSHNSGLFNAVSCYSSTDLVSWTRGTNALTPQAGTNISTSTIVERPKVIYNAKNFEYVMWFHSDSSNYGAAMAGVATSKTPCGPYTYRGSFKPFGADSRDMGVFQDNDSAQTAYLLYASDNNQNFKIARMDADYYTLSAVVSQINASTLESPGIIKRSNVYYLFASHTTGWAPNPNRYLTASSISGPWSSETDLAPSNTRTYYSQNTYDYLLSTNSALYMGDRWRSSVLGDSRYIWLPLTWASGAPRLVWADVWTINLSAGTYTVASGTTYEAESATRAGNTTLISNSAFSNGQAVGYIGKGGTVTFSNVQGTGASGGQWVSVYYANGDSTYRNVTIQLNGGTSYQLDQPDSGGGGVALSVPIKLPLRSGANTLVFGGQTTYAGDLDKIIVYTAGSSSSSSSSGSSSSSSSSSDGTGCQAAQWAQCGGIGYTGCTTCVAGTTCTYANDYYSQCL